MIRILCFFIVQDALSISDTGQWTSWTRRFVGECPENCQRSLMYTRGCSDKAGRCTGISEIMFTEQCHDGKCIQNGWTVWERVYVDTCVKSCTRNVTLVRRCVTSRNTRKPRQCRGSRNVNITEPCIGERCRVVKVTWSEWNIRFLGECQMSCRRNVTYNRQCMSVTKQRQEASLCRGKETKSTTESCLSGACSVGGWTAWARTDVGSCGKTCEREITLRRLCTINYQVRLKKECVGLETLTELEACTGDSCTSTTTTTTTADIADAADVASVTNITDKHHTTDVNNTNVSTEESPNTHLIPRVAAVIIGTFTTKTTNNTLSNLTVLRSECDGEYCYDEDVGRVSARVLYILIGVIATALVIINSLFWMFQRRAERKKYNFAEKLRYRKNEQAEDSDYSADSESEDVEKGVEQRI